MASVYAIDIGEHDRLWDFFRNRVYTELFSKNQEDIRRLTAYTLHYTPDDDVRCVIIAVQMYYRNENYPFSTAFAHRNRGDKRKKSDKKF